MCTHIHLCALKQVIYFLLVQINFKSDSMPKGPEAGQRIANQNILNFKHKGQVYKQTLQNEDSTPGIVLSIQQT